jgi:hypothetical protein
MPYKHRVRECPGCGEYRRIYSRGLCSPCWRAAGAPRGRTQARWTDAEDARLRQLHAAGATTREQARLLGRQPNSVCVRRATLGLAVRGPGYDPAGATPPATRAPDAPTTAPPGTPERVEVYRLRAQRGETLWHGRDAADHDRHPGWPGRLAPEPHPPRAGRPRARKRYAGRPGAPGWPVGACKTCGVRRPVHRSGRHAGDCAACVTRRCAAGRRGVAS